MSIDGKIARVSALWYLSISAGLALAFFVLTTAQEYPPVARFGGTIWVFILTMIITMPLVIPFIKKKYQ